jgi:tetratricopeptide (TPR) repeat protein
MTFLRAKQMADTKLTPQEAMTQAVAAHKAGELAKAERLYRTILDTDPDHADALQRLGVIECQRGRNESGLRLMETALLIEPHHAGALHNRGNALFELARVPEAIKSYRQALAVRKIRTFIRT